MTEVQPPFPEGLGRAPSGVCSRWMGDSPCGAAGTHHVVWDSDMRNGCLCDAHTAEARQNWVYVGLHPYTAACAAAGRAFWLPDEDRCVFPEAEEEERRAADELAALTEELGLYEPVEVVHPPRRVTVVYERTGEGFAATSPELSAFRVTGATLAGVTAGARERLGAWLDPDMEVVERFPEGGEP